MIEVAGVAVGAATGGRALEPDRPLLVMVHGAGLDRTLWQLQTRYFAAHGYSVLAVDALLGHGAGWATVEGGGGRGGPAPSTVGESFTE